MSWGEKPSGSAPDLWKLFLGKSCHTGILSYMKQEYPGSSHNLGTFSWRTSSVPCPPRHDGYLTKNALEIKADDATVLIVRSLQRGISGLSLSNTQHTPLTRELRIYLACFIYRRYRPLLFTRTKPSVFYRYMSVLDRDRPDRPADLLTWYSSPWWNDYSGHWSALRYSKRIDM